MSADILKIFKGAVRVDKNGGVYTPYRLTNAQLERYAKKPLCPFSKASAGIKMEFITDRDEISFGYLYKCVWTHFDGNVPTFDIYADGVLQKIANIEMNKPNERLYIKTRLCGGGEKCVTVYFPHNAFVSVFDIDIGNFKCVPERKRRLLVYGDSVSQGLMGNTSSISYVENYARFFDMDVLNLSVGGEVFDEEAIDENLCYLPTDVIVALGINDAAMIADFDVIGENIKKYLAKINRIYKKCFVTVIAPTVQLTWLCEDKAEHKILDSIRNLLFAQCEKYGFFFADGRKLLPADRRFYTDDTHPNDSGFSQYALNLIKEQIKNENLRGKDNGNKF